VPDASVVIPNYNHGAFVGSAIQSVLDQEYGSYEIIVVDDGSSDNSRDVIARFGRRVRLLCQQNQGLGSARNTGIRAATGGMVGFLDADDQWHPGFLKHMMKLASAHPEAAVFYCSAQGMDSDGRDMPQVFGGPPAVTDPIYWTLLRKSFIIPSCVLMRRHVLLSEGLFETSPRSIHGCEDWDLWLRLSPKYQFVGTAVRLARYRLHPDTFSARREGMQIAVQAVIEKRFGLDDGCRQGWSREKRRAFGGVYRFHALSSVRGDDWQTAAVHLRKAMTSDPTLALDRDLFYDMSFGSQPSGYREPTEFLHLETTRRRIGQLLGKVFRSPCSPELKSVRRKTFGTANLALGLAAYNSGFLPMSRKLLLSALRYRPELWRDLLLLGNLGKSILGITTLKTLREYRSRAAVRKSISCNSGGNKAAIARDRYNDRGEA
jgi:glycosyltransferase involved in cell wall biosynthesis